MRKINAIIILMLMMVFSVACEWDDVEESNRLHNAEPKDEVEATTNIPEMKVAVVLPLDNSYRPRFERVAEWALKNIKEATKDIAYKVAPSDPSGIKITIEWYDENIVDAEALSKELASRNDISAILGPMFSSDAQVFALECAKTEMNILLPCTTSSEVVRKFSSKPWFWSFAETDIRQSQVMLETARDYLNCSRVSLIASTSFYGQTFLNWLPFEVQEKGMTFLSSYPYEGDLTKELAEQVMNQSQDGDVIICSPGEVSDVLTIQNAVHTCNPKGKVILSDIAMDPSLLDYGTLFDDAIGIGITADENSGFLGQYMQKYVSEPTEGECQFYDALVLMSLVASDLYNQGLRDAKTENEHNPFSENYYNRKISDALSRILIPGNIDELFLTKPQDIRSVVQTKLYNIRGASGHLDFDKKNNSSVAHSTYQLWTIKNRMFTTMKYIQETPMAPDAWETEVTKIDEIPTSDVSVTYPDLHQQWALLIAGGNQWSDYRHQADILLVYNMLRQHGYPDDHIILIMDDNIANDPANINKGQIIGYNGTDLYKDVQPDYKLSEITAADITKILSGTTDSKITKTIQSDSDDNILVYWAGNGNNNELTLGDTQSFTNTDFLSLLGSLTSSERKFRKMLWMVDASHAQSVTSLPAALPTSGVLCINSSAAKETAYANQCDFDENLATYLATRFTKVFVEQLTKNPDETYYQVYENLARHTSGSHVNLSNVNNFDNLKTATIGEFIKYNN